MSAPTSDQRRVAAFDFDGTISQRDTLGPFLARIAGTRAFARAMLMRTPQFAAVTLGRADRDREKEAVIAFLSSLIIFPPDDTTSNLDPGDPAAAGFPQFRHGSIRLTVLFNNPAVVE